MRPAPSLISPAATAASTSSACVGQPGDRRDHRHRRVLAQHRSGREERLGCGRQRRHSGEDHRGQLPRRRQPAIPRAQADDADLVEQRPAVESVAFGVGGQPRRPALRQRPQAERAGQLGEIAALRPPRRIAGDPRITADEPRPTRIGQLSGPSRHDCQAPCRHEAAAVRTAPHATTVGQPTADRQWRAPRPDRRIAADRADPAARAPTAIGSVAGSVDVPGCSWSMTPYESSISASSPPASRRTASEREPRN